MPIISANKPDPKPEFDRLKRDEELSKLRIENDARNGLRLPVGIANAIVAGLPVQGPLHGTYVVEYEFGKAVASYRITKNEQPQSKTEAYQKALAAFSLPAEPAQTSATSPSVDVPYKMSYQMARPSFWEKVKSFFSRGQL